MQPTPAISAVVIAACAVACLAAVGADPSSAQSGAGRAAGVRLTVAPIPTVRNSSPGTPMVTWSTGDGSPGLVTVTQAGAGEAIFGSASDGSEAAPWIAVGHVYVFRLYSTVGGRKLLARLKIGTAAPAAADVVAPPQRPRNTSPLVNRLLQLLAFTGIGVVAVLALLWIVDVRRGHV